MATKVYDPSKVSIVVIGVPVEAGFADGEFIRVERDNDKYSDAVGTDGEVVRSETNDDRATVTLTLMQTAAVNELLSALYIAGTPGPFLIRDRQGTTLLTGESCWIAKGPDASFDRTPGPREWKIRVAKLIEFHGANNDLA